MAKQKTKFVFITLEERNGEYEYTHRVVREIPANCIADEWAEELAETWYDNHSHSDDGGHYFNGGEVFIRLSTTQQITKAQYQLMNRLFN